MGRRERKEMICLPSSPQLEEDEGGVQRFGSPAIPKSTE